MLEWERDKKKKKKRGKRETINQKDQISELTFNFHGALSILTFSKNELTIFTKKSKKKGKKRKKKRKKREEKKGWNKEKRKEKRKEIKALIWAPISEKSILCGVNLKILISKFSSHESWKIVGQKTCKRLINNS